MKITRLHILLLVIILALAGLNFYQYDQDKTRALELVSMRAKQAELKKLEAKRLAEEKLQKKDWSNQAIAVAGEIWRIAKKDGRDVAKGQETLKLAKDSFAKEDFASAIGLSFQSIKELETAPYLDIKYSVKRGDCLWNISKKPEHYGKGAGWVKIWKANKKAIPDYDIIHPKQVLIIPKTAAPVKEKPSKQQPSPDSNQM